MAHFRWIAYRSLHFQLRCRTCGWESSCDVMEKDARLQAKRHAPNCVGGEALIDPPVNA